MGGPAAPPPVTGATPPTAAAPAATPVPVAEATVQKLPERLQDVTRPMVLTGTVAGETPEGLTRVRTSAGEVLLKVPTPLPPDKPVTLQITPPPATAGQTVPGQTNPGQTAQVQPAPQTQVARALVLLQGTATPTPTTPSGPQPPPQASSTPTPSVILPTPAAPTMPAASALPMLLPGSVVPALVIAATPRPPTPPGAQPVLPGHTPTPPTASPPTGSPGQPVPPGTTAPGGAPSPAMPGPARTGAAPAGQPMPNMPVQLGGDAAHPGAETPTMKPPSEGADAPEPELPKGGTVALKILTVTPPPAQPNRPGQPGGGQPGSSGQPGSGGQPAATPPGAEPTPGDAPDTPPDAPVLRGTVAGSTPQGQPILATRQGMLALNVPASLPQGTKVTAALTDPAKALQTAAPPPAEPLPMSERDWPAMRQLLATLSGVDRAVAQTLLSTIMPQPNRKLGAALSFFLSAIRGGDARGWLGDEAASALEKAGRGDLLAQLDKEFKSLQRQASEPLPGDWRPYTLPMMDANGPTPIHLHIHPLNDEEEGGEKREGGTKGSRFLLDLDLSRLGPMQLDGLVRPNRFDLILRSHTALPPEFRLDLIQIFADSIRAVGYTGGLSFQSGAKCWVKLTRAGAGGQSYTA